MLAKQQTMLKHTPMLKHMKGDVLEVMRKLMRMNCPTPWTMYGGKMLK